VLEAAWGKARRAIELALDEARAEDVADRIWKRDATLWSDDPAVQATIEKRLGWLDVVDWTRERLGDLVALRPEGTTPTNVTLLGMGGSSLAPEVLARVFHATDAGSTLGALTVLDSTDPDEVLAAERSADPGGTFVVASKSGETIETRSHAEYFLGRTNAPARFIAVTDPGSPLERLAAERGFRKTFTNPPDVGGRYSALSLFGMVPAAAIGIDPAVQLATGREAMDRCQFPTGNPGLELGVALAELARLGRNKVTFVPTPGLEPFGAWAEQLLAESTGKKGLGLIPVDGEPLGSPKVYGDDRAFVHLRLGGSGVYAEELAALAKAGHPVITLDVASPEALGAEFFLWEFATAVAGWRLGINPFDEPNVSESKQNTARLIETYTRDGALPGGDPIASDHDVLLFGEGKAKSVTAGLKGFLKEAKRPRYVAILAFVPRTDANEGALREIRTQIRDKRGVATTVGFGPRYLHSTGQLHKGGPDTGLFIQITTEHAGDAQIPGSAYSFGVLQAAQAAGDFRALVGRGRRVIRLHLAGGAERGLAAVNDLVRAAL
jgi:glucose-6-phosphate isomerase